MSKLSGADGATGVIKKAIVFPVFRRNTLYEIWAGTVGHCRALSWIVNLGVLVGLPIITCRFTLGVLWHGRGPVAILRRQGCTHS